MNLKIMTPAKSAFQGDVTEVHIPGFKGEFGVLPEHAHLISKICVGICTYKNKDGISSNILLGKGVARVNEDNIEILTEVVERKHKINIEEVKARLIEIEQKLKDPETGDKDRAELVDERELNLGRINLVAS